METIKMRPQIAEVLAIKGYTPILESITKSYRELKKMQYTRGEILETIYAMYGNDDPKIFNHIKNL